VAHRGAGWPDTVKHIGAESDSNEEIFRVALSKLVGAEWGGGGDRAHNAHDISRLPLGQKVGACIDPIEFN
jgi:hypothetical protein